MRHILFFVTLSACDPAVAEIDDKTLVASTSSTTDSTTEGSPTSSTESPSTTDTTTSTTTDTTTPSTTDTTGTTLPVLTTCHSAPAPTVTTTGFRHTASDLIAIGSPGHAADDLLFTDTGPVVFSAKFAYGLLSTDLQDEDIEVFLDDCSGAMRSLGIIATDSDGRIELQADPRALPGIGSFAVLYRVLGDGSEAWADLRVFPDGTHILVSDIDGTLTTSDSELFADLFSELGNGGYVPDERDDAIEAMWARTRQGYPLVYLTGRPYTLTDLTRGWLDDLDFPAGTVQLVPNVADILPNNGAVGTYKLEYVEELQLRGFVVDAAYGNATTDIFGYLGAGVDPTTTYILGEHGGEDGTTALGEGYTDHLVDIAAEVPPAQPFTW